MTRAITLRRAPVASRVPLISTHARRTWSRAVTVIKYVVGGFCIVVAAWAAIWALAAVEYSFRGTAPCELAADPAAACRITLREIIR